jgi:hypothetical protein
LGLWPPRVADVCSSGRRGGDVSSGCAGACPGDRAAGASVVGFRWPARGVRSAVDARRVTQNAIALAVREARAVSSVGRGTASWVASGVGRVEP